MTLDCKNYGLMTETEVSFEGRCIVTQGLDIKTLVKLWKWYYHIPPFEKVFLSVSKKMYYSAERKVLPSIKSVKELFYKQGVKIICKEVEE